GQVDAGDQRADPGDLPGRDRRQRVLVVHARPAHLDLDLARRQIGCGDGSDASLDALVDLLRDEGAELIWDGSGGGHRARIAATRTGSATASRVSVQGWGRPYTRPSRARTRSQPTVEENVMSDLVVITFTTQDAGLAALKHIRDVEHATGLTLSDTACSEKDADGKVHVKNEVSSGTEVGAVGAGLLGLLLGVV